MQANAIARSDIREGDHSYLLATGFGTTVAMWGIGYVSRIPPAVVPSWLLLILLLACLFIGGTIAGRRTGGGTRAGALTGIVSGALNLLILGSLLAGDQPNRVIPSALWYIPGSIAIAAILGGIGGAIGTRFMGTGTMRTRAIETRTTAGAATRVNWTGTFAKVAAAATFFLLIVGGFVTSQRAGLSVVDWPNSFGYGMFLYPLSRMTGGIYYEHAHRLFGALVGLTTLVLAIHVQVVERDRRWLRIFSLVALLVVIVQGLLGGLRVTGHLTMSDAPGETAPNIRLAIVHGVLAQIFFAMIVSIAAFTTTAWKAVAHRTPKPTTATDHVLSAVLAAALVIQIVLGAIQRHVAGGLLIHITMAAVILLLAIAAGVRALALYREHPTLTRLGRWIIFGILVQIALGVGSLIVHGMMSPSGSIPAVSVIVRTAHQATGAFLLGLSILLTLWTRRLLAPVEGRSTAIAEER
jgi:heme A synthase